MTARQVIDEIKALTPEEREKVIAFVQGKEERSICYADNKVAEAAADRILDDYSNLMRKLAL